jgi:peptide/nickel transport system substrate-binding protein
MMLEKRFLGLCSAALLAACSAAPPSGAPSGEGSSAPATTSASKEKLVWAWNFEPTADWALESDNAGYLTQPGVLEPLVGVAPDGQLEPRLAVSWERVDDLTWEFTLRQGVLFQNGEPLTADAVVNSLTRVLAAEVPPPALSPEDIIAVTAVGSDKVQIKTALPNPLVPAQLSTASAGIMEASAYRPDGTIDPTRTGTGPFILIAANLPQGIQLEPNPTYWGGAPLLGSAEVRYITDGQTRVSLIQSGEVHLASALPPDQLPILQSTADVSVLTQPLPRFTGLYLNNGREPFNNVAVRQAIQAAIDVDAIANQVIAGGALPASGPFRSVDPWAPSDASPIALDQDRVSALLAEAGVDPSDLNLEILAYSDRPSLPIVAAAIQEMLSDVGITSTIRTATYNAVEPDMLSGNYDMALVSRNYLYYSPDPLSFLTSDYTCSGTYNISQYCDPDTDEAVAAALGVDDAAARYAIYSDVARKLQEEAVDVFLYNEISIQAVSTRVQDFALYTNEEYFLTSRLWFSN